MLQIEGVGSCLHNLFDVLIIRAFSSNLRCPLDRHSAQTRSKLTRACFRNGSRIRFVRHVLPALIREKLSGRYFYFRLSLLNRSSRGERPWRIYSLCELVPGEQEASGGRRDGWLGSLPLQISLVSVEMERKQCRLQRHGQCQMKTVPSSTKEAALPVQARSGDQT